MPEATSCLGSLAPTMKIARELYDEMIAHAREEAPNECCGMVGSGDGHAIEVSGLVTLTRPARESIATLDSPVAVQPTTVAVLSSSTVHGVDEQVGRCR